MPNKRTLASVTMMLAVGAALPGSLWRHPLGRTDQEFVRYRSPESSRRFSAQRSGREATGGHRPDSWRAMDANAPGACRVQERAAAWVGRRYGCFAPWDRWWCYAAFRW